MRILLPLHAAGAAGGIGTLSRELSRALPAAVGSRHELLMPGGDLRTRIASPIGAASRLTFEQVGIARAARSADLLHLPDYRPLLFGRTPTLATVHDVTFVDHPEWFTPFVGAYKRALLRALVHRHPTAIACVSAWSRDRMLAAAPSLGRADVRVIPPGVAGPGEPPQDAPVVEGPYVLTVSAIEPRKNHLGFLRSFQAARRAGLDARWVVVGVTGTGGEPIREVLDAAEGVDVRGRVGRDELELLYRDALAVVLPSHAEGFGFPVVEAMVRGAPVICSQGSALDETAGDAAVRLPADDTSAWTAALLELARDDDARAEHARAGRSWARRFTWEACAGAYAAWYDDLAERLL